jgi:hypothetical protein
MEPGGNDDARPVPESAEREVAYVKPTQVRGVAAFAIHASDGTELAVVVSTRDVAFATVRQHDMNPVSVH